MVKIKEDEKRLANSTQIHSHCTEFCLVFGILSSSSERIDFETFSPFFYSFSERQVKVK